MARYTGNTCPVCKEKFTDHDDIVVCPDCGTPYHRACWKTVGVCVHKAEHATGFEWKPDVTAPEAVCANCGTHNAAGATHCTHCGVPMDATDTSSAAGTAASGTPIYARGAATRNEPRFESYAAGSDGSIYRRELGPDDVIDGIKARDWASYVGRSSMYFLMQFFRMNTQKRSITACFSALLFGPAYLFYRKMWKEGFLTGALFLLLQVPSWVNTISTFQPALLPAPSAGVMSVLLTVCEFALIALRVIIMLYAVTWYKQDSTQQILSIYDRIPEGAERTSALQATGGTSFLAAAACVVVYYLFTIGCMNLAGPEFFRALFAAYGISL